MLLYIIYILGIWYIMVWFKRIDIKVDFRNEVLILWNIKDIDCFRELVLWNYIGYWKINYILSSNEIFVKSFLNNLRLDIMIIDFNLSWLINYFLNFDGFKRVNIEL